MSDNDSTHGFDEDLVRHIAKLARLELSEPEITTFSRQFGVIIEYFDLLSQADTDNVTPANYSNPNATALREDRAEATLSHEEFMQIVPKRSGQFVEVAPIFPNSQKT